MGKNEELNELTENESEEEELEEEIEDEEETEEESEEEKKKKKKLTVQDIIDIVESTLVTVFVVVLVFTYILHPVNIVGHSMVPTLNATARDDINDTDKVFMTTVYFDIDNGDILVIDKSENYLLDSLGSPYAPSSSAINECIIKRVIAKGGQTVDIRDGNVYVDGNLLDEPYINEPNSTKDRGAFTGQYPITIPDGYFFVMGDNRNHSSDSREESVGLVKKDQIYGKAIIKYYPLNEFKFLK